MHLLARVLFKIMMVVCCFWAGDLYQAECFDQATYWLVAGVLCAVFALEHHILWKEAEE